MLMGCLAEMTVAHSTSGSFGAYAEFYISPLAGFLVRYAYWVAIVAVGTEVATVAMYMKYWFASVPERFRLAHMAQLDRHPSLERCDSASYQTLSALRECHYAVS